MKTENSSCKIFKSVPGMKNTHFWFISGVFVTRFIAQVGKSACIVLAKERHSKGERVPFSA